MPTVIGPRRKLRKAARLSATPLEDEVAQALFDLEVNNQNLKKTVRRFYVNTAKEVDVGHGKRAIVVFYPLRFLMKMRTIQKSLIGELEKKFSGKQVILIAQRKIARKPKSKRQQSEIPHSRTMMAVHNDILTDITYPADVVGRRWLYKADGSKHNKVFLDAREKERVEGRLESYCIIYKKLTGKDITFGFMTNALLQQFQ
eukprot:NODE_2909_length_846_cov_153.001255_g2408_i0.p1 GENE.NODE_2909_length_846_cov_153.001255_g2408_i0~~NODE_2909_length_846_cov_153.001255_g2408_i0.p1  ORF type:complete len:201 (+),score=39.40 NODE_2909_length_846_cov_153.001255_g2408_i0:58-660(+)